MGRASVIVIWSACVWPNNANASLCACVKRCVLVSLNVLARKKIARFTDTIILKWVQYGFICTHAPPIFSARRGFRIIR